MPVSCKQSVSFKLKSSHAILLSAAFGFAPMAMAQTAPQVTNDAANVYYQIPYSGTPTWVRVFVDNDRNAATGFRGYNVGASHLIENGNLYRYTGSNGAWGWTFVKRVSATTSSGVAKVTVSRADIGSPSAIDSVTQTDAPLQTSSKLTQTLASSSTDAASGPQITNDAANIYYQFPYSGTPTWVRVFVDNDRNAATGFRGYNVGASHLIENGNLYRYTGSNGAWGWTFVKRVSSTTSNGVAKVTVSRADIGSPSAIDAVTQTDAPLRTSSKLTKTISSGGTVSTTSSTLAATTTTTRAATTTTQAAATTTQAATTTTQAATTTTRAATTTTLAATTSTTKAATTTTTVATTTTTTAPAVTGPTFYISPNGNDSNAGSQSAPWRTIQKAANSVNPGDTVVLMDGTYQQGEVGFNRSGTSTKPITFKAQNKWKATVASTSGCQPGFSINASYVKIKDLRFTVAGNSCGTYTSANVHIRAWNTNVPSPSNPTSGSMGFHADGLKLESGTARSEGLKSNQDFTILENIEADNALELFGTRDSIIRNNLVTGQDQYGVSIFAKGGVRNAQIYNNVVRNRHNDGYGIYLGGYSCDSCFFDPSTKIEAYNSVAYNNVVINDSGRLNGLVFAGAKDSAFFNNIVIGGGVVTMQGGYNSGFRAPTTNPTLMNNIIICNGAQAHSGSYSGTYKVDSNNFYNCSGVPAQTNAITGDPMLVNPSSDWNLQANSPARNRGAAASITGYDGKAIDVSRDKKGVVRSAPWDLGIYNY